VKATGSTIARRPRAAAMRCSGGDGCLFRRRALSVSIALAVAAAGGAGLLVPATVHAAQAVASQGQASRDYAIPAGALDKALDALSAQGGVHVDYSPALVAGKTTRGVTGHFAPSVALQVLLRGTGLAPRAINGTTFVLQSAPRPDPPDPRQQPPASAPSAPPSKPETLQTIVVTGSHIRRVDIETANPVVAVTAAQIQQTGDLTLGDIVQNLSAVTGPINNPYINNAGHIGGATQVGLRGLGPSRTLVLINGQRVISNDLNAIPAQAVERIEVLTNGASSVYGSDAIGGVINILLKSNYEGAQFQASYGISDHDDGERKGFSFMFGQTSDKGSILAGVDYNKMDAIEESARQFSRHTESITGSTNTPLHTFFGGSSFAPRSVTTLPPSLRAKFGCTNVSLNPSAVGQTAPTTLADFHCTNRSLDLYDFAESRPITTPQERTDAYLNGVYHLTSNVDAFLTVLHNRTQSGFLLGPPVWATNSGLVLSQYSMYNPFGITFSPTNGNVLRSRLTTMGNRFTAITTTTDEGMFGLRGNLGVFGQDWTWDVGYNYGHVSQLWDVEGLPELPLLLPGLGPSMLVNGVPACVSTPGDPNTVIPGCIPWDTFNLENPASLEVVKHATTPALVDTWDIERIKHADISGGLFDLPAGTVQLALGAAYRTEYTNNTVDPVLIINDIGTCTFSSQCTSHLQGGYSVKEAYAELFIPVLKDLPFVHALNVDLGDRYSKFSDFGSTNNWKIGVEYRPIEDLLLRGTVAKVFRAPTIGDIFAGTSFGGQVINSDPCDHITVANPACVGVPLDGTFVDTQVANHQQINTLASGSAFANFPLGPENGKSFDFGAVYSPHFLPGFSASIDTWRIYLNDVITGVSGGTILTACFNGLLQFCPLIKRFGADTNSPGQIIEFLSPVVNLGRIDVKGTDLQASYTLPNLPVGQFAVTLQGTYLDQYNQQTAPGQPGNRVIGMAGNANTDVGGGIAILLPRVRGQGQLTWQLGPWSALWRMQYIGRFEVGSHQVSRGYSAVPGFRPGNPYVLHYGAYVYNDLAVGYDIAPLNTRIDFGVNNVFDKQPPLIYNNITGLGNANTDSADFDVIGRYYWGRLTVDF